MISRALLLLTATFLASAPFVLAETSPQDEPPAQPSSYDSTTTGTRLICGYIPNSSYDARIKAVRLIGKSIPSSDFEALVAFLEKNPKDDPATSDELDAIRNDVAGRLLACDHLPDSFSRRFLAMVNAPHVGPVWQNYTLQFLDSLWLRETDPAMRRQIQNTLVSCTYDSRMTISGTALLTLSRLPQSAGVSSRELGNIAIRMINDEKIAWQDKVTALQVAAGAGDLRALAQARTWAEGEKTPVMLRMSAFATIGMLGDSADKPLLDRYAQNGEFRLRSAARAALKKIENRNVPAQATQ